MATRRTKTLLLPFAWSEGLQRYVGPSPTEVANGLACGCICEACGRRVLARQPMSDRVCHFAHEAGSDCPNGLETAIHRAAKQIIAEERRIWVPSEFAYSDGLAPVVAVREQVISVETVEVEKSLGQFRPDLVVTSRSGRLLAVEIVVTHPVGEEKEEFYRSSGTSALQIDLSKRRHDLTLDSLKGLLLNGAAETGWIHNAVAERVQKMLTTEARPRAITWRKSHKRVGMVPHVDSCPVPRRATAHGEHEFSNAKLDCPRCPYFVPPPNPKKIFSVLCSGHLAAKYPLPTTEDDRRRFGWTDTD